MDTGLRNYSNVMEVAQWRKWEEFGKGCAQFIADKGSREVACAIDSLMNS